MSAGQVHVFWQWVTNMTASGGAANFWADTTIKMGIITNATPLTVGLADPRWGTGGSNNLLTNEVTPGGNYSTGGILITATVTSASPNVNLNAASPISLAANAANPTGAFWGVFYDATAANGKCFGYIDLGGPISLVPGLSINVNSVGSGTQILFQGTAT